MQLLAQKSFKVNLPDFLFLEQNELLKNFRETLDRFHQSVQDNFGFSGFFSKLFAYDVSSGILICLLVWSRIIKLLEKRIPALNSVMDQISDFKLSVKLSAIYHYQMDITELSEQATTKNLLRILI